MSKIARTGGRADSQASAASTPGAEAMRRKRTAAIQASSDARSAVEATGGNMPSTLDPDL